jgi:hypothetical protein
LSNNSAKAIRQPLKTNNCLQTLLLKLKKGGLRLKRREERRKRPRRQLIDNLIWMIWELFRILKSWGCTTWILVEI